MVKNMHGGNKAKGHARKTFDKPISNALRLSNDPCELYAQVTAPLGNGMCHVLCAEDGATRLCHIRGKFRGRGKSNNIVKRGSLVLVGRRQWESAKEKKLENCDLLEVYSDFEIDKLKTVVKTVNWAIFAVDEEDKDAAKEDHVEFTDRNADEYSKLLETIESGDGTRVTVADDDDVINVDDI